jgi:hypothetical protein
VGAVGRRRRVAGVGLDRRGPDRPGRTDRAERGYLDVDVELDAHGRVDVELGVDAALHLQLELELDVGLDVGRSAGTAARRDR